MPTTGIIAYCVKEHKKTYMKNPRLSQTIKGTPIIKGICSCCGTKQNIFANAKTLDIVRTGGAMRRR